MPLVPVNEVEDMWFHALENNYYDTPEVTRFADYVTEQWVESWNHYDNDRPRTTNNVEGWHSKINKTCKTAHPNIYTMVKMLQNIQSTNEAKLIQLCRRKTMNKEENIQTTGFPSSTVKN